MKPEFPEFRSIAYNYWLISPIRSWLIQIKLMSRLVDGMGQIHAGYRVVYLTFDKNAATNHQGNTLALVTFPSNFPDPSNFKPVLLWIAFAPQIRSLQLRGGLCTNTMSPLIFSTSRLGSVSSCYRSSTQRALNSDEDHH